MIYRIWDKKWITTKYLEIKFSLVKTLKTLTFEEMMQVIEEPQKECNLTVWEPDKDPRSSARLAHGKAWAAFSTTQVKRKRRKGWRNSMKIWWIQGMRNIKPCWLKKRGTIHRIVWHLIERNVPHISSPPSSPECISHYHSATSSPEDPWCERQKTPSVQEEEDY